MLRRGVSCGELWLLKRLPWQRRGCGRRRGCVSVLAWADLVDLLFFFSFFFKRYNWMQVVGPSLGMQTTVYKEKRLHIG